MNRFQAALSRVESGGNSGGGGGDEPATVKVAEAVSTTVFDHQLTESEKKTAGPAVHYGFGAFNGALYGAMAKSMPGLAAGGGLLFGAGLWALADEAAVPALGLSKAPTEYPAQVHMNALAAHLVYGAIVDASRRLIEKLL